MFNNNDTIIAITTPYGESAIGVVRLSGPFAISETDKVFAAKNRASLVGARSHTLHFGEIKDGDCVLDEVLVSVMKKPNTYTCEDVVEISCHGNPLILQKVLDLFLSGDVRLAEPGEFTKRSFFNGRMDALQAEAVADIISARTEEALFSSLRQLSGDASGKITELSGVLKNLLLHVETEIDFSEDDTPALSEQDYRDGVLGALEKIDLLLGSFDAGVMFRSGLNVVIAGKPNSGKSSLLNALVKTSKAIVSPIPGTTRDSLEHSVNLKGIPCNLVDTAGLREAEDIIEQEGVVRAKQHIDRSHLVLFVTDASVPMTEDEKKRFKEIEDLEHGDKRQIIVCLNKVDIRDESLTEDVFSVFSGYKVIEISALNLFNIELLEQAVFDSVSQGRVDLSGDFMINIRHKELLEGARVSLLKIKGLQVEGAQELWAFELKNALELLGQILGTSLTEDLLDCIFSSFCIGK